MYVAKYICYVIVITEANDYTVATIYDIKLFTRDITPKQLLHFFTCFKGMCPHVYNNWSLK